MLFRALLVLLIPNTTVNWAITYTNGCYHKLSLFSFESFRVGLNYELIFEKFRNNTYIPSNTFDVVITSIFGAELTNREVQGVHLQVESYLVLSN